MRKTKFFKQGKLNHFFDFVEKVVPCEAKGLAGHFWQAKNDPKNGQKWPFLGVQKRQIASARAKTAKTRKGRGRDLK